VRRPVAHLRVILLSLVVFVTLPAAATLASGKPKPRKIDVQPSFPVRATIYYPWFPEGWTANGVFPQTRYKPTLGYYNLDDVAVVRQQLRAMQYGRIRLGISSWIDPGNVTDRRFARLLSLTTGRFRWAVYYEREGTSDPTPSQIRSDLLYIKTRYGSRHSYFRVRGRFAVFVYNPDNRNCDVADRWRAANTVGAYVVLQVFPGYQSCASQPAGWHEYGGGPNGVDQSPYSFTIMPGFFKRNETAPLFPRDLVRWRRNIRAMVASKARFQIVTSFNEWFEGTAVESAQEWATRSGYGAYLDALHVVPTTPVRRRR
jgi:hypothetical protein